MASASQFLQAIEAQLKERIIVAERALLYVLGFDLTVAQPQAYVEHILRETKLLDVVFIVTENGEIESLCETANKLGHEACLKALILEVCRCRSVPIYFGHGP